MLTKNGKYLNPMNAVAFKHIFGADENRALLLAMLNAVLKNQLHHPIKKMAFLKDVQDPSIAYQQKSIADVLCETEDGTRYIIQMAVSDFNYLHYIRWDAYAANAYLNQREKGGLYENLKEVIFLMFTEYVIFPDKVHYKHENATLDKGRCKQKAKDFSFTFVELPKFDQQRKKNLNELSLEEKFYYFLHHASAINPKDFKKLLEKAPIISQAFELLDIFYWSEQEIYSYEKQQKIDRDYRAMVAFSMEKGREIGKVIQELKKLYLSEELIENVAREAMKINGVIPQFAGITV